MSRLPTLSGEATGFVQTAQKICADRRSNSMTLSLHTQILEVYIYHLKINCSAGISLYCSAACLMQVLEIPQLMDTCVRNQYYDEALELMFYVKRLEKKQMVAEIPVLRKYLLSCQSEWFMSVSCILHHIANYFTCLYLWHIHY